MRLASQLLFKRFFASPRTNSVSKGIKSELNFKEGNTLMNPYDVVDRNIPGMEKRLSLLEMRRLKEQLELDHEELCALKVINEKNLSEKHNYQNSDDLGIEITYKILSNFPGLNCPIESSLDSSVLLSIPMNLLNISETDLKILSNIIKYDIITKSFEISISNFPFVSQNKNRAIEIFGALLNLIKNHEDSTLSIFSAFDFDRFSSNLDVRKLDPPSKVPEFPIEWILNLKANKINE